MERYVPLHPQAASLRSCCALACAAVALFFSAGCGHPETTVLATQNRGALTDEVLSAAEVVTQPWPRVVRAQGSLLEDEQALVGAKVAGRIKEVAIDLGSMVKQGQEIAALDAS